MILFADSFDHYNTAYIDEKWTTNSNASIVAGGRCSTNCLKLQLGSHDGYVVKGVSSSGTTVIVGCAVKTITGSGTAGATPDFPIMSVLVGGVPALSIYQQLDGSLKGILRPDLPFPDTSFLTGGGLLPHDNFYFVEFKILLSATVGTVDIQINGISRYTATGLDTSFSGTTWTGIKFGEGSTNAGVMYIDDLYISDGSGAVNTGFLGDVRVEALEPTGNGAVQSWTLGAGSTHWGAVDDGTAPDADTTYISSSTVNQVETNVHEDSALPVGSSVFGVQVVMLAKKDQPGNRLLAPVSRQGGVNYVGANLGVNQDSYTFIHNIFETNPATSAAWSIAEVNASEFGVKVTA